MTKDSLYKIGEVSEKTGLTLRTIRYYHELGLIKPVKRTSGNYRLYDDNSIAVLKLISSLRNLDFSLDEIINLLINCPEDQNIYLKTINRTKKVLMQKKNKVCEKLETYQQISKDLDESLEIIEKCIECRKERGLEVPCKPDCTNNSVHINI